MLCFDSFLFQNLSRLMSDFVKWMKYFNTIIRYNEHLLVILQKLCHKRFTSQMITCCFFSGAFLFYRILSLVFQLTLVVLDPVSKIFFSSHFYAPGISLNRFKDKSVKTVRANFGFEPVPFCLFILTSFYFVKPCLNVL